jgi:hypothetical protein
MRPFLDASRFSSLISDVWNFIGRAQRILRQSVDQLTSPVSRKRPRRLAS